MTTFTRTPSAIVSELRRNHLPNGSFEDGLTGWVLSTNAGFLTRVVRPDGVDPLMGEYMVRWAATTATDTQIRTTGLNEIETLPGETVTASTVFRVVGATRNAQIGIEFVDGGGTVIGSAAFSSSVSATSSAWTYAEYTGIAPALTARSRVLLKFLSAGASQQVCADGVMITKGGALATPYFDGAVTDAPPIEYRWAGPAFLSPSVQVQVDSSATLTPPIILAPFSAAQEMRTTSHVLMQSYVSKYTMNTPDSNKGQFVLGYDDEAHAIAARNFFAVRGLFTTSVEDLDSIPASFVVSGGDLRIEQNEQATYLFTVTVPWSEVLL